MDNSKNILFLFFHLSFQIIIFSISFSLYMNKSLKMSFKGSEFTSSPIKDSIKIDSMQRRSMFYQTSPISSKNRNDPEIVRPRCVVQSLNFQMQKDTKAVKTISNSYSEPNINSTLKKPLRLHKSLTLISKEPTNKKESPSSKRKRRSCSIDVSWQPDEVPQDNLIRKKKNDKSFIPNNEKLDDSFIFEQFQSQNAEQVSPLCIYNENEC